MRVSKLALPGCVGRTFWARACGRCCAGRAGTSPPQAPTRSIFTPRTRWHPAGAPAQQRRAVLSTNEGFRRGNPDDVRRRGAAFRIERRGVEFLAQWISGSRFFRARARATPRRRCARRGIQGRALARGDTALPARRPAGRAVLATRARLVPRVPLKPDRMCPPNKDVAVSAIYRCRRGQRWAGAEPPR
jgi:hypothetical protein